MANPTIGELQHTEKFKLLARPEHKQIKNFIFEQLASGGKIIRLFMVYQGIMILAGLFFFVRSLILSFQGENNPLFWALGALVFSFSLLIIMHELLHFLALKWTGAPRINIGGSLKKFIFYAEADRHVLNRKQYTRVALTPFVAVKMATLTGMLFTAGHPAFNFWMVVMSVHSLFCAGDFGMLAFFSRFPDSKIYTFDMKEEKRSYFFMEI
ncbi:MAG: DUF3267 domain-containing protein [Mariniphaga sp.]|nr:DUF3267 domain-containing protein [Mariniphaga sp.]